jgi:undecaprenyl-diphosphatase
MDHLINGFRSGEGDVLCVGITASAVSGFLAIAFLIEYLKRHSLNVFAYYRFLLAGAVLVVYFVK